MTLIAPTLQAWFTDRLARQLQASPRTIASYRDTLRLLLGYVHDTTGKQPSSLDWDDLNEPLIARFLDHLEHDRHNGPRTRNLRLTAIRSLFKYAALRHPEHAAVIQHVLVIPPKRFEKRTVTYLTSIEAAALINAPDRARWEGRRDHAMLTLAIHAGLRVSELIGLDCGDVVFGAGAHVRCHGKGRKQRAVPLTADAQAVLQAWLAERAGRSADPLFPTRTGRRLSRDAVAQRVSTHAKTATTTSASLQTKQLHPHVLRHSCAMSLLQAGVDTTVFAPPSPTCTPISPSKKRPSRSSPRRPSPPAATSPQTPFSPSSKSCDYADIRRGARPGKRPISRHFEYVTADRFDIVAVSA
jgi:site-specific recombinase XerD